MQRGFQLGLLLLVLQLFQEGLGNIPVVTLAVLGFNVYLYMFPAAPPIKVTNKNNQNGSFSSLPCIIEGILYSGVRETRCGHTVDVWIKSQTNHNGRIRSCCSASFFVALSWFWIIVS